MKLYIIALVLTLGFIPQHAQAVEILTTEPGIHIEQYHLADPLNTNIKPAAQLGFAPFHFDPMGSHPNNYVPGQCTWGAESMKGNVPEWGNANNWDDGARAAGITVSDQPIVGAIAQTDRGYYGHVAVVVPGGNDTTPMITEMNYDGLGIGSTRTRIAAAGEFVYIYV